MKQKRVFRGPKKSRKPRLEARQRHQNRRKVGDCIVGGATAAVGGLLAVTNQTAEYADEIDKLSERTGINREELAALEVCSVTIRCRHRQA